MRVLLISKDKHLVPPEQLLPLIQRFVEWRKKYHSNMECFEFFAVGNGGFGIINVPDETALHQMMIEYPFVDLGENEIYPILDGDQALARIQAVLQAMMASKPS